MQTDNQVTEEKVLEPNFHDVALAQVCDIGWEVVEEYSLNHGCIAVTLNREDNNPAHPFKPVARWLNSDGGPSITDCPAFYVTERDDLDDGANSADYRAPACDAVHVPDDMWPVIVNLPNDTIEVVVAYMVRNRFQGDDDWDIEVTAMQWHNASTTNFWQREPDDRIYRQFTEAPAHEYDEFNPDIAYYHGPYGDTWQLEEPHYRYYPGDVYLVYTDMEDASGCQEHIKYRQYHRYDDLVSSEYLGQTLDGHNGYDPSIDVGFIEIAHNWEPWVAIAYTSQFHANHTGYHVCATAWPVDDVPLTDRFTLTSLRNPNNLGRDAGLPCLDIAPDWNMSHYAVLSYTQVTGSDGFGPTTDTFVVRFLGQIADLNTHLQVIPADGAPLFADTLYSSVVVNNRPETPSDIFVSLAFMAQDTGFDNTDIWHPGVARMRIWSDPEGDDNPLEVTWSGWADGVGQSNIIGNYNLSDIPFQNPGVSSAIVTVNNDRYWASWNDRIEMEPAPEEVWASWGFAG